MVRKLLLEPLPSDIPATAPVTEAERATAAAFGSARRRLEYLGWRAIVRRELGPATQIGYDAAGAPRVDLPGVHIAVAHCRERIAVCISDRRCTVDIESAARNFHHAMPRYLSDEERALSDDPLLPAVVWCAKEALYKYAGQPGLDLRRDIRILSLDLAAGAVEGSVVGSVAGGAPIRLTLRCSDGFVVVYRL